MQAASHRVDQRESDSTKESLIEILQSHDRERLRHFPDHEGYSRMMILPLFHMILEGVPLFRYGSLPPLGIRMNFGSGVGSHGSQFIGSRMGFELVDRLFQLDKCCAGFFIQRIDRNQSFANIFNFFSHETGETGGMDQRFDFSYFTPDVA